MAAKLKLKKEVHSVLDQSIAKALDGLHGTGTTYDDIARGVTTELCTSFDNDTLLELLPQMVRERVKSAVDSRSIERSNEDQGELFSDSFLESLIKIDGDHVCKTADANWAIIEERDRRIRANLSRVNRSFDRWNLRRDQWKTAGMDRDMTMTVMDAVATLREST